MADTVWRTLCRNETATDWTHKDGNALSWPQGPRTTAPKRWMVLHWPDGETQGAAYEYDTLDNALAALNKRPGDGGNDLTFAPVEGAPIHTKQLWYGVRAGRCPQKLNGMVSRVWLKPIRL